MRRVLLVLVLASLSDAVLAVGGPSNVLVVRNANSPTSISIAAYYMAARGIPAGNLVTVSTLDSSLSFSNQLITFANYQSQIEQPIRTFLSNNGLTNQIQYIVLTKGVPHRLSAEVTGGDTGGQSVDSLLAGIDLVDPLELRFEDPEIPRFFGTAYANRYWRAGDPFSHARYGGYLVTRLDGYTEANAKALVDRALAPVGAPLRILLDEDATKGLGNPALQPKWYLLPDGNFDPSYELSYADYNADMTRASQIISGRAGLSVQLDQANPFVGSANPLTAYVSWGSNDSSYSATTYNSLTFAPRSVAETAVSSSGRTFLPTMEGQSLIADLIAQGVAGAKGYATEPFLDSVASPSVFLDLYTSGRNLAESFYAASRFVKWKDVVLGDPLMALSGTTVSTIPAAKSLPDGTLVSLNGKTVTAGTNDFNDRFYIQETNRTSGIQVRIGAGYPGIARGLVVSVRGLLTTINGERVITNASVVY